MSYRTILMSLNEVERAQELLNFAIPIAQKNNAHLIGLHVIPALDIPPTVMALDIPERVIEEHNKARSDKADKIQEIFEKTTQREDVSAEWRCTKAMTTEISQYIIQHARCSDLVIVDQGDYSAIEHNLCHLPAKLLMETGRPVIIVPYKNTFHSVAEYPLIAWNGSKEAARAAFDAIPLLRQAEDVKLVWLEPEGFSERNKELAGTVLATSLARHNIGIETSYAGHTTMNTGEALLEHLRKTGADLLIMGGYGHSRLREYIFGGATQHILQNMTVPVLMSH